MIASDCMPRASRETVFEVLDAPDTHGRQHFFMYWLTDYIPGVKEPTGPFGLFVRAQIFHAELEPYLRKHPCQRIITRPPGTWAEHVRRQKRSKS